MFNQYFGVPELQLLQQLGFEAFLLGNHEFDVGAAQLGKIFQSARLNSHFHILSSNARNLAAVPALDSLVQPHLILKRGNLRVGIFGLTTPATNVESNPAPVFLDSALIAVAQQEIRALRAAGCQVVILLSHLGLPLDRQLAAALSGVDAIIGGHSHDALKQPVMVKGIPIVQAGEFYRYVGKLRLVYDGNRSRVLDYTLQEIDEQVPEAPEVAALINRLQQGVIAHFSPLLGNPYQPVSRTGRMLSHVPASPEKLLTPVGELVTAALRWYVKEADCALEPTGHIVENLYPGAVTPADVFRVYPYGYNATDHLGFRVATIALTGGEIQSILAALATHIDFANRKFDYLLQSQGLHFTLMPGQSGLVPGTITLNGKPLQPDSLYTIVTSSRTVEYLKRLFGLTPRNLHEYPVSVVQVVTEFVALQESLTNKEDKWGTP
jgi:2',3'-cyclic-nucleotide 2'-phosphodiesterase (5'-nucleotidase family)